MKHKVGGPAMETKNVRLEAMPHGGSLGATMNQGGSYSRSSDNTLPELLNQGGSTKRGSDGLKPKMLKTMMGQ